MPFRTSALLAALLALTVGCTGDKAKPAATESATVGASAEQQELAGLARKAAAASFDGTYDTQTGGTKGAVRILALPPSSYRVDVIGESHTAQYYDIDVGVVSCSVRPGKPSDCFLVAKKGEPVPERFDPGVQDLFTAGPEALAANPQGYAVGALPDAPAVGDLPAGRCFHVERLADLETVSPGTVTPPGEGFETGDYCFDPATGVLVSAKVTSGTLTLSKLGPPPTAAAFVPPTKPIPQPSNSPTPTPTTSQPSS